MSNDTDFNYDLDYEDDRAAFELERDTAWDNAVEDAEADRFEYLAGFAAPVVTVNPSFVFVERPDGSFDVHERRTLCVNRLLPFTQPEVA